MELVVWGTGKLFREYKDWLGRFTIIKFCDNDPDRQGAFLNGIEIISPSELEKYEFTYVVIMAYAVERIYGQIRDLGIEDGRIVPYFRLWQLTEEPVAVRIGGKKLFFDEWVIGRRKCILLVSHNFSYTGIPVALYNMANVLRHMGFSVVIAAMGSGPFIRELEREEIAYIDHLKLGYRSEKFRCILHCFKAVVLGTFSLFEFAMSLETMDLPVIWWVHETHERYYTGKGSLPLKKKAKFLAGGGRVKRIFEMHYNDVEVESLQYCIPDVAIDLPVNEEKQWLTVAVIGTVDERKAQDILLEAVIGLPVAYREWLRVVIVGRADERDVEFLCRIRQQAGKIKNLQWIAEMSREELEHFYDSIDILVCPSRDDPMPIVVTQAMMHRKVCVISDQVGQAEFVRQYENGFVFQSENACMLKDILKWLADNGEKRREAGMAGRNIYEREFSETVMEERLEKILEKL